MFVIIFERTQALLLSMLRFSWPRIGRGIGAKRLRNMDCLWPQTRPGHGHDPVQCRPRTQTVRVREQSASASCPRPQPRSQTVRVHGLATDSIGHEQAKATVMDCPQPVRSRGLSTNTNWPWPRFIRSRRPADNCPRFTTGRNGFAPQPHVSRLLKGSEERIRVQVDDGARHNGHNNCPRQKHHHQNSQGPFQG